jgi:hypothetical protein
MEPATVVITPDVRCGFVSGAMVALHIAGLSDDDIVTVLKHMNVTQQEAEKCAEILHLTRKMIH